jgi:hypothetical protein
LKASFDHYEHVIAPSEILKGRTRPIEQNCSVKAVCMTNYREMLTAVMYEVFKMALGIPLDAFEIIDRELTGKFNFLHVGGDSKRKNAQMVVDAFLDLYDGNNEFQLILKYYLQDQFS